MTSNIDVPNCYALCLLQFAHYKILLINYFIARHLTILPDDVPNLSVCNWLN